MNYATALKESTEYFNGDKLAAEVFLGKYALTTPAGEILETTPDAMHRRLAREFARVEKKYPSPLSEDEIYRWLKDFKYIIPQGSPMFGIGNPYQTVSLANCFVVPSPLDAYSSILNRDEMLAQISKRRGGVGINISNIRPANSIVRNAARTSTGIGPFMERFSNTIREVGQNARRGALMQTISVHHPEIETFINIKKDKKKVTGANISIMISDEFMKAVKENKDFELRFPVDSLTPTIRQTVSAKDLWDKIVGAAWESAEPGILFWDNVLRGPADSYETYKSISTNPCAELPLGKMDSCRLLAINLLSFVKNPFTSKATFDTKTFVKCVGDAQKLMDDLVDLEVEALERIIEKIKTDPEPEEEKRNELYLWQEIKKTCIGGRRTGLGITALGDTLAALGIRYGSLESIEKTGEIYKSLALGAYKSSINMSETRGPFPDFNLETELKSEFIKKIVGCLDEETQQKYKEHGRRNIALTTTAPTGSVSMLTQTTSGVEPAFEVVYKRRKKINPNDKEARVDFVDDLGDKWQEYEVYHHQFSKWMEVSGKSKVEESPYWKSRANDVDWQSSVDIQAAAQEWCCHSISKTCNIPSTATKELVGEIYMKAWEKGLKGFTVYRDGCRTGVLITENSAHRPEGTAENKFLDRHAPKRPKELPCEVVHTTVQGEKWTFFVGLHEDRPYEIMGGLSKYVSTPKRAKMGKIVKHNGLENPVPRYDFHYDFEKSVEDETIIRDIAAMFENATNAAFTRTISLALRHGAPVQYVVEQLLKSSEKEDDLFSFSRAVSRILKHYIKDGTKASEKKCPSCGSTKLIYQEGCVSCQDCGHSKCS